MLSLEEFAVYVACEVGLVPGALPAGADLRDDLGLDSMQLFLVLIAVEDLGVSFPEALLGEVRTLGDAHHHYVTARGHRTLRPL